jgi:hypothetical protein
MKEFHACFESFPSSLPRQCNFLVLYSNQEKHDAASEAIGVSFPGVAAAFSAERN